MPHVSRHKRPKEPRHVNRCAASVTRGNRGRRTSNSATTTRPTRQAAASKRGASNGLYKRPARWVTAIPRGPDRSSWVKSGKVVPGILRAYTCIAPHKRHAAARTTQRTVVINADTGDSGASTHANTQPRTTHRPRVSPPRRRTQLTVRARSSHACNNNFQGHIKTSVSSTRRRCTRSINCTTCHKTHM